MIKSIVLLVVLSLTAMQSTFAFAAVHTMKLLDENQLPLVGYAVEISIQTGENEWTDFEGVTDNNGHFTVDVTPHSTATNWWALIWDERRFGDA